jgi:prepilin-type N-terminal cleavage/methylation domain-containing protein
MHKKLLGFTLIEILVVISIISVLSGVIYASFGDARASSRDKVRKTSLKELALALEMYKAQYGFYPAEGCGGSTINTGDTPSTSGVDWDGSATWTGPGQHSSGWGNQCPEYIEGLAPEFIAKLPLDPNQEAEDNRGFVYRVSAQGDRYKVLVLNTVEVETVDSYNNEFARCPYSGGSNCGSSPDNDTYAIYSSGAEDW